MLMNNRHHSICMRDEVSAILFKSGRIELIGELDREYKGNEYWCEDAVSIAMTAFKIAALDKNGNVRTKWYEDYYMDYYDADTDSYRDVYHTNDWKNVSVLCAGEDHLVGLTSDGRVYATGNNDKGQCNVSGWTNMIGVAACGSTTIGLRADGSVIAVGDNSLGACNAKLWKNIKRIYAGDYSVIGIQNDGRLVTTNPEWEAELSGWSDIVNISISVGAVIGVKSSGRVLVICDDERFTEKVMQWTNIIDAVIETDINDYYAIGLRSNGKLVSLGSGYWDDTFTDKRIDIGYMSDVMTPEGTVARDDKSDYAFSSSHSSSINIPDIFYTILGFIILMAMFGSCNS